MCARARAPCVTERAHMFDRGGEGLVWFWVAGLTAEAFGLGGGAFLEDRP